MPVQQLTGKLKKWVARTLFAHARMSFSQSGEDIILSGLFTRLGISRPRYLDIGANEPKALSNTYRLYKRGGSGVCVEPNPVLCDKIRRTRKRDTCIQAGVAFNELRKAAYYVFPAKVHGLNTFSAEEAAFWENTGNDEIGKWKVEKVISTELVDINELMSSYFKPWPNLISLDVEGLDLQILQTIDFNRFKPEVFCVETLWFGPDNTETRNFNLIHFLEEKGYFIYADTYINSIFCRKDAYAARNTGRS